MNSDSVIIKLKEIVGDMFASNEKEDLYIYSQDSGASEPRPADYVIMPKSVEEVQELLKFANKEKIPITPMGGGLTLSGLAFPVKRGIVVDMKRMDRIIEINESCRYAIVEAGVTTGKLIAYLRDNHPSLQPPIPDSPSAATIAGNVLIHGSGSLSQRFGDHSSLINGLEVVLPDGEIYKLGSCAVSNYWFSKGPIPDLIGIFTSSFGTLGIITKVSIKLFPKLKFREVVFGFSQDSAGLTDLMLKITSTECAEDVMIGRGRNKDVSTVMVYVTADSNEELDARIKIIEKIYSDNNVQSAPLPERNRNIMLEQPQTGAVFSADWRKGGGFEYVGSFIPLDKIPEALDKGFDIAEKYGMIPALLCRIIGKGHAVMFSNTFPFNRADPKDMGNARNGLEECNKMVLEIGGIPWKAELNGQKMMIEKMDPNYKKLLKSIKSLMDPNGIMNPGNWEV
jgi:glycolate oxidase